MQGKECHWCGESNASSRINCSNCGSSLEKPTIPQAAQDLPHCRPKKDYDPAAYHSKRCCVCDIDLSADLDAAGLKWSYQLPRCPYCNGSG